MKNFWKQRRPKLFESAIAGNRFAGLRRKIQVVLIAVVLSGTFGIASVSAQAKYVGDPVTKSGLMKALKLRQFQTSQIVAYIRSQGVDFRLTDDFEKDLRAAGARPELIEAVRQNFRGVLKIKPDFSKTYEGLISQAITIYESAGSARRAIQILNEAIALRPNEARGYQMLGFVTLYGLRDFKLAETHMRTAIQLGGSAVFRVFHAHDVTFSYSCQGSMFISRSNIRFEDDENIHTFQVRLNDILKIDTVGKWTGLLKRKGGLFKIIIRDKADVRDKDKYDFSPLTGKDEEAKMIIRLTAKG